MVRSFLPSFLCFRYSFILLFFALSSLSPTCPSSTVLFLAALRLRMSGRPVWCLGSQSCALYVGRRPFLAHLAALRSTLIGGICLGRCHDYSFDFEFLPFQCGMALICVVFCQLGVHRCFFFFLKGVSGWMDECGRISYYGMLLKNSNINIGTHCTTTCSHHIQCKL